MVRGVGFAPLFTSKIPLARRVLYNQLKSPETSESITKISPISRIVQKVSKEMRVYTEEDHLGGIPDEIKGGISQSF